MKVLLDTNIVIHRESKHIVNEQIGNLFRLMEKYSIEKFIHPLTIKEISQHKDAKTRQTMAVKLESYEILKTLTPMDPELLVLSKKYDQDENSKIDSAILNEVVTGHVDMLVSEDRQIHEKSQILGISEKVFTIDGILEWMISENPDFIQYPVPSVEMSYFGNVNLDDPFFDSFKDDYVRFSDWFKRKRDESAYICKTGGNMVAFLYLKPEGCSESYHDISPVFRPKNRLKIGTFKVAQNGYKIGERFIKIIFDNAIRQRVDEIYVTIFRKTIDHERLVSLLGNFGFYYHGVKTSESGEEDVFIREMTMKADTDNPAKTFPFISPKANVFLTSIYPEYHTSLFPDSILRTENPEDFIDQQPHRNAVRKVFISRSYERRLNPGDVIVFYRTGGRYKGVATTLGIVERVIGDISSFEEFKNHCRKRSVFNDVELREQWDYCPTLRPFVVQFLYACSFQKRPNLDKLVSMGVVESFSSVPRGFGRISWNQFRSILEGAELDENAIVN